MSTQAMGRDANRIPSGANDGIDTKLEVVVLPVSDVVSEVYHFAGGRRVAGTNGRVSGPDPDGNSYRSWASFSVARERGSEPEPAAQDAALHVEAARKAAI